MQMNTDVYWAEQTARGWEPPKAQTKVLFYDKEYQNNFKTEQQGRPIFDTVTFIKKMPPGDKNLVIDRKACKHDYIWYPQEYEMYQKRQTVPVSGTPIDAWSRLSRSQVAEFKAMNIFTVEQIAALPDNVGHNIMGFQGIKNSASAFLRAAAGQAEFEKMENHLKELRDRNKELESKITESNDTQSALLTSIQMLQEQVAKLTQAAERKEGGTLSLPKK